MEKLHGKWRLGDPYKARLLQFRKLMRKAGKDSVKKPHIVETKKIGKKTYYRLSYEGASDNHFYD